MDRIEAMRAFVQVVDSGSFTQAALALGRHQATTGDQVQPLEARLGVRLLVRSTRTVTPTAEGLAYRGRAAAILQQPDEPEAGLRRGRPSPAGRLRVEVPMPARLITNDSGAVLAAGLDGLGIVQIAEFVAAHHLASGALLRVLPARQCPALPLHLLTPGTRHRPARVQVLIDWVQGVLARRLAG